MDFAIRARVQSKRSDVYKSSLILAEVIAAPGKDWLRRYGLFDRIGETRFYPTVGEAVNAYVAETGVPWVDWQDRDGS